MKIKTEFSDVCIEVFAIYWFEDESALNERETYFLGLPKNQGGLIAYRDKDVSIINSEINFNSIYFINNMKGIFHWALIKEQLLDDILENSPLAYERFLEVIKLEGLVEPDFF